MKFTSSAWLLAFAPLISGVELPARCGDCWCINGSEECPGDVAGIVNYFDDATLEVMSEATLTNNPDFLTLQTADGQSCYPFADLMVAATYAESQFPQCALNAGVDGSVCGYLYDSEDTDCLGRSYEIHTYESEAAALAAGAVVTHSGACGVCSSMQDFHVRMRDKDTFQSATTLCATSFVLGGTFAELIQCFADMGLTDSCGLLWAHFGAANANECATQCFGSTELNGPAPECALSDCLECAVDIRAVFDDIAGRTFQSSGIIEAIARPCEEFTYIEHDVCSGLDYNATDALAMGGGSPTPSPTVAPSDSGAATSAFLTTFLSMMALMGGLFLEN
eukprot:Nitzschia sp. Nitz4//scaffold172_size47551//4330//5428//NITZ4_007137-RA/size47551-augustus-gene-0.37-mRNA-1//1//CDS//3329538738//779//frame0